MTEQFEQLDRKDLKIQALLEKVSRLAAEKENEIADLRVELTLVSQELQNLRSQQEADGAQTQDEPLADDTSK